jgi:hypothetical protein
MAAKSATSSTKSDRTLKTFITFRVVGDKLVPDEVTQLLKMQPTHARLKGKPYSTGKSENIIPSTNIWFFSTDTVMASNNIVDHIQLVLFILGLMESSGIEILDAIADKRRTPLSRVISLKLLLRNSSAKATMTLFWHGASGSSVPKIPEGLFDILKLIEVDVEVDFDKDEDDVGTPARRRSRAA